MMDEPATEKQRALLKRYQVRWADDPAVTKFMASKVIDAMLNDSKKLAADWKDVSPADAAEQPKTAEPAKVPEQKPVGMPPLSLVRPPEEKPTEPTPVSPAAPLPPGTGLAAISDPDLVARYGVTRAELDVVKNTVAQGASDHELILFLGTAKRLGLNPLTRQIHYLRFHGKAGERGAVVLGIDGLRSIAQGSGEYDGQDEPSFVDDENGNPVSCTVRVYRKGVGRPIGATVWMREVNKGTPAWRDMPHLMLAKVAESIALRKGFPQQLSGVYGEDEMGVHLPPPTERPPSRVVEADHHEVTDAVEE